MNDAVCQMDILFAMSYPDSAGMVQIWVTSLATTRPKLFISPGIEIDTACRIFKSCRLFLFGQSAFTFDQQAEPSVLTLYLTVVENAARVPAKSIQTKIV